MKQKHFKEQKVYRFKRFVRKAYSAFNSMHRVVNIGGVVTAAPLHFCPHLPLQPKNRPMPKNSKK